MIIQNDELKEFKIKTLFRMKEFKVNIILKLADYHYSPVTVDEVYKEVLAQAVNFKRFTD